MEKTGMGLSKLKDEYEKLQKKQKLPGFKEMNEAFYIEEIADSETDILIRRIRIKVGDGLMRCSRFIESLLNPVNASMFSFSLIKMLTPEDKKTLSEIYKKLVKEEIKFIELDLDFDEEKEAEFIRESYGLWKEITKEIKGIFEKVEKNQDNKTEENSKGYFG